MGRMDRAMQMLAVMREYGWTYEEYMRAPAWVLSLIMEKMRIDRKKEELAAKRAGYGR